MTDVLAFDLREDLKDKKVTGEIIISTGRVVENAKKYKTSQAYELIYYVIHGILHLLGYRDHDPEDINRIRAKEQQLLKYLT